VLIQLHYGHTKYVYKIKDKLQASTGEKNTLMQESKPTHKQTKMMDNNCKYVEMFTHRLGSEGAPSRMMIIIIIQLFIIYVPSIINNK
jgi:hypothetical protein